MSKKKLTDEAKKRKAEQRLRSKTGFTCPLCQRISRGKPDSRFVCGWCSPDARPRMVASGQEQPDSYLPPQEMAQEYRCPSCGITVLGIKGSSIICAACTNKALGVDRKPGRQLDFFTVQLDLFVVDTSPPRVFMTAGN